MRTLTLALVSIVALPLAACDQKPKNSQEYKFNANGGSVTVSGNGQQFFMKASDNKSSITINGSGMGENVRMPDFAPLYPGAKVTASMSAMGNNGKGGMVAFETAASAPDVIAFYKQKASAAGFTNNLDMNSNGSLMYAASSEASKKSLQVVASSAGSGAHVQVTWGGE